MFISKSKASKLFATLAILSVLALSPSAAARDMTPVVPVGVLAHATTAIESDTGGQMLEIRLADAAGPPGFEALAKGDHILDMHVGSVSDVHAKY